MSEKRPLTSLKGIGARRAEVFAAANISDVESLLTYFPASFRENVVVPLNETDPAENALTRLVVESVPRVSFFAHGRRALRFSASDGTATCEIIFFYQTYLQSRFVPGSAYYFYGRYKKNNERYLVFSPEYVNAEETLSPVTPIYPLVRGLTQKMLQNAVQQALPLVDELIEENLPIQLVTRLGLMGRADAVRRIHCPKTVDEAKAARERFAFEELYFFRLDLLLLQKKRGIPSVEAMKAVSMKPFFDALGFVATEAQNRAIAEITGDLVGNGHGGLIPAMHRLLQGDVGSGKTAVAAASLYLALQNGKKCALMAPTELLAKQHEAKLAPLMRSFGFETYLLCGSTKAAERRRIEAALNADAACLLIGTHALLSDWVQLRNFALVVVDEQHRFGVRQRDTLLSKAQEKNLLVMSATPIPRTLALFLFSKDDVSVLDELPPGRTPIRTFYIGENKRARADAFIKKELEAGGRAYLVCPLIEENEESDLMAAESRYEEAKRCFAPFSVGFLHGKMSTEKKRAAMEEFATGKTQVLVSTTVIEIGIDVPEASVMCIENAERFGLATLHQLRGRVGRGSRASTCILISSAKGLNARERLKTLCETTDGFRLAEFDMKHRGPGDFFGVAQSGKLVFSAANSADEALLEKAARAAEDFFEKTVDN